jgi:hypothetical protein
MPVVPALPPTTWVLALLVSVAGCGGAPPSDDDIEGSTSDAADTDAGPHDEGSTGDPATPDACAEACGDLASREGIALCHSCRCKDAFDDWLPPASQLQCENAETIVTYHARLTDTGFELEPSPPSAVTCANPSLLTGSCRQGSRLGRIDHDDVSVVWVCRDPYLELDGRVVFEDMAVIGHNRRTGATCFWDDINDVMHEDDAPPLDLLAATEDERARFVARFSFTDGSGCIGCHDHDPFLYTPYLQSTGWTSVAADKGPYHLVDLSGAARPTNVQHLVSPEAAACTTCHRLGSENTCSLFAPDALGVHKTVDYEPAVHAATEPGSPHWPLAYWMPGPPHALTDFTQWEDTYATAKAHILQCCESPGVNADGCAWAPVPAG